MKKNKFNSLRRRAKIGVFLSLLFFLQAMGGVVCHAQQQNKRLTVEFKNTPMTEVLDYIKRHTRYDFLYNNEEIKRIPDVTMSFSNATVTSILDACLKNTVYTYRISQEVIVIQRRDKIQDEIQEIVVRGKVVDEKGEPLPGATVVVQGTKLGMSSDAEGKFSFHLPQVDSVVLTVSFVGMESVGLVVTDFQKEILIELKSDTKEIDEVVITGYANVRKSSFTGNAVTVSKEELMRVSKTNVLKALEVFDPSFRIRENNQWGSDPNTLPEMQIRGQSTIGVTDLDRNELSKSALQNNPNLPIFIMDGFEVSIQKVYDMDPNRIETITILKDAAATALYGSRAANGIVVITTVAPQEGEVRLSYSLVGSVTFPDLSDYNLMNAAEKVEAEMIGGVYDGEDYVTMMQMYNAKKENVARGVDTYWLSQPLRTAFNHQHSIWIEGGSRSMRYGLNLSYNNEDGVMKESYRNRVGVSFRFDYLMDKVQISNQISYGVTKSEESPYGDFSTYTQLNPYEEFKDENGKYLKELREWRPNMAGSSHPNPLYEATIGNYDKSKYNELTENLSINWYIFPTWQIKGELSVTQSLSESENFTHPESLYSEIRSYDDQTLRGSLNKSDVENISWEGKLTTSYNEMINLHNINALLGINVRTTDNTTSSSTYRGFPSGEFTSVTFAKEVVDKPSETDNKTRLFGLLGTVNYSYNNIYLLDLSLRLDGSSEFGSDRRWAPFWSAGVGLNMHNYKWMESSIFDMLRIRGSFGQTGSVNFSPYAAVPTHQIDINRWYVTGAGASLMSTRGNPDLEWEKTNKFDAGIELEMFDSRLSFKSSYYYQLTNGLIMDVTLPSSTGFDTYKSNMGKVLNEGFEVDVQGYLIKKSDVFLTAFFRLAHNTNTIKEISDALRKYNEEVNNYYSNEENDVTQVMTKYEEGQSLTAEYGMQSLGIDPATGKELFVYRDGSVGYDWIASEMVNIGDTEPWGSGSFGVSFTYKGFSLYTTFTYEFGANEYNSTLVNKVENADFTQNVDRRALSLRWQKPGDVTMFKDVRDRDVATTPTSRFMQHKNVLEWNSISLEYEFPAEWLRKIGCERLRLGVDGNDLWRLSTIEAERGLSYPYAHTVNFSLSLSF